MGINVDLIRGFVKSDVWNCPVCRDLLEDAVRINCEHVFCRKCITQALDGGPGAGLPRGRISPKYPF